MRFFHLLFFILAFAACRQQELTDDFLVFLVVDGRELSYSLSDPMTVEEFLAKPDVNVRLSETDRLTPPRFTQLSDGMRITIVRVTETTTCETVEIPFTREIVQNEGYSAGEQRIVQQGQNGTQQICYRVSIEDGVARDRVQTGQPTIITAPVNEIMIVGIDTNVEPVVIQGTLAYINNSNAWVISGSSTNKRLLSGTGNLDSLVFSISPDGRYLLYTAKPTDPSFLNELWLQEIVQDSSPIKLVPTNVLTAQWIPQRTNTFSYSTGEPQAIAPFWRSLNNLLTMEIDIATGTPLNNSIVIPESGGGLSGWWGTVYQWSPDGQTLAWVRADSMGIVAADGSLKPLMTYPFFRTNQNWSWRSSVSWSPDGALIAATSHGAPIGSEPPETSPVFDAKVVESTGLYQALLFDAAGMWASPQFSPANNTTTSVYPTIRLAYLQAREPYNSVNGDYDLVIADRDGSNRRVVFPPANQPGIKSTDVGLAPQNFTWNPAGNQLAVIYQGNLWVVDVDSGAAYQLTFDGQSQHPVWAG
jgi:hypothetical protein